VGDGHELVQGQLIDDGIEGEVDLRDVKDDTLRAVVLRCPKHHREGDATAWDDAARPTPENRREGASLDIEICNFWKAARLMRLRTAPPSIRTWYSLTLEMVREMTSWSCPAPAMFLVQLEALKPMDVSIHLW
jgi:hypothetical protein